MARATGDPGRAALVDPRRPSSSRRSCTRSAASSRTRSASWAARRSASSSTACSRRSTGCSPTRPGTRCCSSSRGSQPRDALVRSHAGSGCSSGTSSRRPVASTCSTSAATATNGSSARSTSRPPTSPIARPVGRRWRATGSSTARPRAAGSTRPETRNDTGAGRAGPCPIRRRLCAFSGTLGAFRPHLSAETGANTPFVNFCESHAADRELVAPVPSAGRSGQQERVGLVPGPERLHQRRARRVVTSLVQQLHERVRRRNAVEVERIGDVALG